MANLTLGNELTGTVSREVSAANRVAGGLGESLSTGKNKFVDVVDGFLGNSLRDNEVVLSAIAKNTAYSINMLTITDEYLNSIAGSLQEGLKTIGSAGPLSVDKLAVLQKNLNDKKGQVNLLINTADFDGKSLLGGGAKSIDVQVGNSITDKLTLSVNDQSAGKLFRSSVTTALNAHILANGNAASTYYASDNEIATDVENNTNLIAVSLANAGGSGTGGGVMTDAEFEAALNAVIGTTPAIAEFLNVAAPLALAQIQLAGGANTRTFRDANAGDVTAAMGDANARAEIVAILSDNAVTDISQTGNATADAARTLAQDVFQNALNTIRSQQAHVTNQKENVIESADALRATTNVTQQAADSYLKTDYVMSAQEYSETIRTMVASITALQAANKIPEAAQRLLDALAR